MKGVLWKAADLAAGGEVPQMYGAVVPLGIGSMITDLLRPRLRVDC